MEKRITTTAKNNVWHCFKLELSIEETEQLTALLKDAGFYRIDAGDEWAFVCLDYWDQTKGSGAYGADILQKLQSRGWFPNRLDIQFEYANFVKKNIQDLTWFVNWVAWRLGDKIADKIKF